jgi:tripartite-type tricarboxylate transporter receptor subunit TctC
MNFASAGIGAASHLAAEKFNVAAGIKPSTFRSKVGRSA